MSTASTLLSDDSSQCLLKYLPIEHCTYRGEGNANLVVALFSERKVIRLKKSDGASSSSTSVQEDFRRVRREVDFIRDVISAFFHGYICVPEVLLCDQGEISRLSEKIHLVRPESRRSKGINAGYATVFPDYAFLPQHLSTFSSKPTFCVEIKPKQAFVCELDRQFKKCPYCLTQYYKMHTGVVEEVSDYCPFELFSGNSERMDRALEALLRSPQNNLRIFKDGVLSYAEEQREEEKLRKLLAEWFGCSDNRLNLERFLCLVRRTLMRSFLPRLSQDEGVERPLQCQLEERSRREAAAFQVIREIAVPSRLQVDLASRLSKLLSLQNKKCEFTGGELPSDSVLERILRVQKLHLCGADTVAWIYANCSTLFTDDLLYDDLLDSSPQPAGFTDAKSPQDTQNYGRNNFQQKCLQHLTVNDCFNVMQNYLLFCTAKDCSILMAFQEIDKKTSKKLTSEHIIEISSDKQAFLANTRILDLDMKSLKSIEKHRERDNNVLQSAIKELEKQLTKML